MNPVRFAIIGTGNIAAFHARAIGLVSQAQLIAVHSRREKEGRAFAATYRADFVGDLGSLLARDDVDAVCITTPSGTHAELGMLAAKAGKHVLCEKPLDTTPAKIDELVRVCDENGVKLGAVFQGRFGRGAMALKEAATQGRFGKMAWASAYVPWYRSDAYYQSAGWRGTWALDGGGALMNQSIHAVDLLLYLAGQVEEVSARCTRAMHQNIEVEDTAMAWLSFKSGALGVIQGSTACFPGEPKRIEIKGSSGSATLTDDRPTFWQFADENPRDEALRSWAQESSIGGGASDPNAISIEGHRAQIEDFALAISENREPSVSGREARRSVELICAIYESDRTGQTVQLNSINRR